MFPALHIPSLSVGQCRRIVLFSHDESSSLIEMRHYQINLKDEHTDISEGVKEIVAGHVSVLSEFAKAQDAGDFVLSHQNKRILDEDSTLDARGLVNKRISANAAGKRAVTLRELGPRLTLRLIKIEAGVSSGETLYHSLITKTPEEVHKLNLHRDEKERLKQERKAIQSANVEKKRKAAQSSEGGRKSVKFTDDQENIGGSSDADEHVEQK